MTALITIASGSNTAGVVSEIAADQAAEVADAVAARLAGASVVVPYDTMLREWIRNAEGEEAAQVLTAQQVKLLVAGYIRAGYHVVIHGSFARGDHANTAPLDDMLRLMRTVPDVHVVRAAATGAAATATVDVPLDLEHHTVRACATAICEPLPPGDRRA